LIFHSFAFQGIARTLVKAALQEAAKKREMRYADLKKIEAGVRRHFHDDITVVVVFIDPTSMARSPRHSSPLSIRGGGVVPAPANF
jgi:pyruvate dehydrogenase phosphatase